MIYLSDNIYNLAYVASHHIVVKLMSGRCFKYMKGYTTWGVS